MRNEPQHTLGKLTSSYKEIDDVRQKNRVLEGEKHEWEKNDQSTGIRDAYLEKQDVKKTQKIKELSADRNTFFNDRVKLKHRATVAYRKACSTQL